MTWHLQPIPALCLHLNRSYLEQNRRQNFFHSDEMLQRPTNNTVARKKSFTADVYKWRRWSGEWESSVFIYCFTTARFQGSLNEVPLIPDELLSVTEYWMSHVSDSQPLFHWHFVCIWNIRTVTDTSMYSTRSAPSRLRRASDFLWRLATCLGSVTQHSSNSKWL